MVANAHAGLGETELARRLQDLVFRRACGRQRRLCGAGRFPGLASADLHDREAVARLCQTARILSGSGCIDECDRVFARAGQVTLCEMALATQIEEVDALANFSPRKRRRGQVDCVRVLTCPCKFRDAPDGLRPLARW